jgi:hypothetical protein
MEHSLILLHSSKPNAKDAGVETGRCVITYIMNSHNRSSALKLDDFPNLEVIAHFLIL